MSHKPTLNRLIVRPEDYRQPLRDGDIILDGNNAIQVDFCEGCGTVAYNDVSDTTLEEIAKDALRWYNVAVNQLRDDVQGADDKMLRQIERDIEFNNEMRLYGVGG